MFAMGGRAAYVCVCLAVTMITEIACIDLHQTGFVGKGSDHLKLIKFWPFRAPGKGVCGETKKIWLHLTKASAQCLRLSEHFFHCNLYQFYVTVATNTGVTVN